ncbi:hypothetical protein [Methylobacterium frigidaeris]|uniref:Uncharacterized protein n=2 Tax=Methylobacterium frigidaeris TaxID=2038277 RepID=A0AA37HEZ1_9HYPH|nr:hypothetical protein [Methylobacterium frigidaeris]PIK72827.1 hypothetical protein CS379_11820 [Methylobacterium frigidaeris]GJD64354.1 hypothetical protein MPEAHAMD_4535 [Methylobacterium frigidaeris]
MIDIDFPDAVQWRVATHVHDWLGGDALRALLGGWAKHGLIGRPSEFEVGDDDDPWIVEDAETLADAILRVPRNRAGGVSGRMRGDQPRPWGLSFILAAFDTQGGRTEGYSIVNLNLPRGESERNSAALLNCFEELCRPDRCEYASIHPRLRAEELRMFAYTPPLTIAPMFAGLFWANFLGPGTIEAFDVGAIDSLAVARRRWFGDRGVAIVVTEDIASICTPKGEKRLIALTDQLRAAVAPN